MTVGWHWAVVLGLVMLWLALLVTGASFGGLIHGLLVGALVVTLLHLPPTGDVPEA